MAISSFNQSVSFSAVTGCAVSTAGMDFADDNDLCDEDPQNAVGFPAACAAVDQADDELPGI
jgi:hypothetical protein